MATAYCTTADLRAQLSDSGSRLDESALQSAVNTASRDVDAYTGRRFYLDDTASPRLYEPDGYPRVLIDDVGSLTGLAVESSADGSSWTALSSGAYELGPLNASADSQVAWAYWWLSESPFSWFTWAWQYRIRVTARWGWSAVPDQVQQATILRAVSLFKRKDAPYGVAGFDGFGAVRIRLDPDVQALLAPFVKPGGIA